MGSSCDRPIKVEFNNKYLAVPFKKEGTEAQTYGYYRLLKVLH